VRAIFEIAALVEKRFRAAAALADRLPQAILSKAFSGELVSTEAELARTHGRPYETAEELLSKCRESRERESTKAAGRSARARASNGRAG